ncbi:hypothetical protein [Chroococcidiopsis cubana]|uniref:hypothetical protein n=1 Tax=Chroococcidiopsis cubana TaxID=171392 RepID=UPI002ACD331B|nr:hypothetical protein [Chroococcidiopsis cubana]
MHEPLWGLFCWDDPLWLGDVHREGTRGTRGQGELALPRDRREWGLGAKGDKEVIPATSHQPPTTSHSPTTNYQLPIPFAIAGIIAL